MSMQVTVIEDVPLLRHGIVVAGRTTPGVDVVAAVGTSEAGRALAARRPDVVLLGIGDRSTSLRALGAIRRHHPDIPVLTFGWGDDPRPFQAGGADAHLSTSATVAGLWGALAKVVAQGATSPRPATEAPATPLSPREGEVLAALVRGGTNQQIADELYISSGTVKTHVSHVLRKLDVSSRAEAVAEAFKRQLV